MPMLSPVTNGNGMLSVIPEYYIVGGGSQAPHTVPDPVIVVP